MGLTMRIPSPHSPLSTRKSVDVHGFRPQPHGQVSRAWPSLQPVGWWRHLGLGKVLLISIRVLSMITVMITANIITFFSISSFVWIIITIVRIPLDSDIPPMVLE